MNRASRCDLPEKLAMPGPALYPVFAPFRREAGHAPEIGRNADGLSTEGIPIGRSTRFRPSNWPRADRVAISVPTAEEIRRHHAADFALVFVAARWIDATAGDFHSRPRPRLLKKKVPLC